MELTKRKVFLLLVGACGVVFVLLGALMDFHRSDRVLVLAANFRNTSVSYLSALNLNLSVFQSDPSGRRLSVIRDKMKQFNIPSTHRGLDNLNFGSDLRELKLLNDSVLPHHAQNDAINVTRKNDVRNLELSAVNKYDEIRPNFISNKQTSKYADPQFKQFNQKTSLKPPYFNRRNVSGNGSRHNGVMKSKSSEDVQYKEYNTTKTDRSELNNVENLPKIGIDIKNHYRNDKDRQFEGERRETNFDNPSTIKDGNDRRHIENNTLHNRDINKDFSQRNNDTVLKSKNIDPISHNDIIEEIRILDTVGKSDDVHNIYEHGNLKYGNHENLNTEHLNQKVEPEHRQTDSKGLSQSYAVLKEKNVNVVEGFSQKSNCLRRSTGIEDLLCMNPPTFLPDFRNPCWYQANSLRCLPYFHIIGVCKTGTTDLFERLSHHPQVIKNNGILGKETWYWSWRRYGHSNFYRNTAATMTLDDFIETFDSVSIQRHTKRQANGTLLHPFVTGHGDPMDFWDQTSWKLIPQNDPTADVPEVTTPSLIKHINPNIKLILLLRDPTERLFSNYLHGQFGKSSSEFHEDVLTSLSLLTSCTRNRTMKACLYDEYILRSLKVPISGSFYVIHLKEWLKAFPRKQIYITRTEDFSKSVANTLLGIFRFLKLDPLPTRDLYRIANMPHFYNTKAKQTAGDILDETRTVLRSYFQPYNQELAALLKDEKYNF